MGEREIYYLFILFCMFFGSLIENLEKNMYFNVVGM
jgi:hypothetical protein